MTTHATRQNESTMDKIKDKLHIGQSHNTKDKYNEGGSGTAEGVSGPHNTRTANALDPRVDSDRDNSATVGTGYGSTTGNTGFTGSTTTSTNAGPHDTNIGNKLDPRVDSDLDNSATLGSGYGSTTGTGNTGFAGGMSRSTNAGPHDSNVANKLDPRVDSDLDNRGNRSNANTGGTFGAAGSYATPGSGTAQNTAGPHNSDWVNKADPRVDSDRDNSATLGRDRTYA